MRRNPPTPEGEPENAPNPLDDVPSSQSAERLKVSADQHLGPVPLPDLTGTEL